MNEVDRREALLKLGAAVAGVAAASTMPTQVANAAGPKRILNLEIRVPTNIEVRTNVVHTGKELLIPAKMAPGSKKAMTPILSRKLTFDLTTNKTKEFFNGATGITACCVRG